MRWQGSLSGFGRCVSVGSGHRASNPVAEARGLLVHEAPHPPNGAAAAQGALGLPVRGDAVALRRLCSREAVEKGRGEKGGWRLFL